MLCFWPGTWVGRAIFHGELFMSVIETSLTLGTAFEKTGSTAPFTVRSPVHIWLVPGAVCFTTGLRTDRYIGLICGPTTGNKTSKEETG